MEDVMTCAACDIEIGENWNPIVDAAPLCESCYHDHFFECDECGRIGRRLGMYYIDSTDQEVCEGCFDDLTATCDNCGVRDAREHMITEGHWELCDTCYEDEFVRCDGCGELYRYTRIREIMYCPDCTDIYGPISSYGYKPDPIFYGSGPYVGLEIEIDDGYDAQDVARHIIEASYGRLYCKYDGSLNHGFEVVSHPMDLHHVQHIVPWAEIFEYALDKGFRSHNTRTCGLHVHVGREALGDSILEQELTCAKLLLMIDLHWDNLVTFSRRNYDALSRWSSKPDAGIAPDDDEEAAWVKMRQQKEKGRYCALNLENYATIEFRLFRGTMRPTTIIATVQLVLLLVDIAKRTAVKDIWTLSWHDIATSHEYEELTQYLEEKGLV